jgi:hypothetical protein
MRADAIGAHQRGVVIRGHAFEAVRCPVPETHHEVLAIGIVPNRLD